MAKAILLVRVSTLAQSYEQQTKDLKAVAIHDGYDEKDLIIIENKESAIKKDEEHRLGLVEMKERIGSDPSINCVYVREASRIGRRYDVLQGIKTFLVANKIQLIVAGDNRVELLDKKGEITLQGSIMFEVACSVAINEMSDKALRFKQGKQKAVEEGRVVSGTVLFGYRVNEKTKRIEKDDENYGNTASVIEYIFDTYTTTSKSTKAIYLELSRQGKFTKCSRDDVGANQIRRIIMNRAYSGGVNNNGDRFSKKVFNYHYPAIVSEEKQEAAINKCVNAKKLPKYSHKHVYYAKSILQCVCGHTMIGESSRNAYKCPYCRKHIGLNAVDYAAWTSAIILKTDANWQDRTATREKYKADIAKNETIIKTLEQTLVDLDDTDEKNVRRCSRMTNQARADKLLEELFAETDKKRKNTNQEILRLTEANRQMKQYLKNDAVKLDKSATGAIASIEDDNMRREIILEVISRIKLEDIDEYHIKISIIPNYSVADSYPFYYVYDQTNRPYIKLLNYAYGRFNRDDTQFVFKRFHQLPNKKRLLKKEERLKAIGNRMSVAEISERFGYAYSSVYNFFRLGLLKGEMINRKIFIALEDAEEFFSKQNKG